MSNGIIMLAAGELAGSDAGAGPGIADSSGLLQWLGKARASAKFADLKAIRTSSAKLNGIVRQWITRQPKTAPGMERP